MKFLTFLKRKIFKSENVSSTSIPAQRKVYLKRSIVVLYPELMTTSLDNILQNDKYIRKYAYILHDKQSNVRPHYHLYLEFDRIGVSADYVANVFGVNSCFVECCNASCSAVLFYMLCSGLYSISDIVANFDISEFISTSEN